MATKSIGSVVQNGVSDHNGPKTDDGEEVKSFSDIIGPWGKWQKQIFVFFLIGSMFSAWQSLGLSFYAPNMTYWCKSPNLYQNMSMSEKVRLVKTNDTLKCHDYATNRRCQQWEYDDSFYSSTIISEWDLVCDRSWLSSLTQSCYMLGVMFTVVLTGQASDRFGRLPAVWVGVFIEIIAGVSLAFATSVEYYMVARFLLAVGTSARWGAGFVMILESSGPEYRSNLGLAINFGWAFGYIVLPAMAYLIRDFRYLQLATSLPALVFFLWWRTLPESPRWQMAHGKESRACKTMENAAAKNGRPVQNVERKLRTLMDKLQKGEKDSKNEATMFDLWKYPNIRRKTLLLYFSWFVNAFVYYGLSLNTNNLGGNPFFNFLLAGFVEFPAYYLSMVVLNKYGRRLPMAAFMFAGGFSCLATLLFYSEEFIYYRVAFAMVGKFCVTCSFGIIYVYSAEIFPTVARNVGVGSSSMTGRIGSILAPFVKELGEKTHITVPLVVFGVMSVIDGFLILYLPETKGRDIPDTLEQAENFEKSSVKVKLSDLNG